MLTNGRFGSIAVGNHGPTARLSLPLCRTGSFLRCDFCFEDHDRLATKIRECGENVLTSY
jgi:hypothetical protein